MAYDSDFFVSDQRVYLALPDDQPVGQVIIVAPADTDDCRLERWAKQLRTCPPAGTPYRLLLVEQMRQDYPDAWAAYLRWQQIAAEQMVAATRRFERRKNPPASLAEQRARVSASLNRLQRHVNLYKHIIACLEQVYSPGSRDFYVREMETLAILLENEGERQEASLYRAAARELEQVSWEPEPDSLEAGIVLEPSRAVGVLRAEATKQEDGTYMPQVWDGATSGRKIWQGAAVPSVVEATRVASSAAVRLEERRKHVTRKGEADS